jgi:hypothetical protein
MTKRWMMLSAVLLVPGLFSSVQSKSRGADEGKKALTALQTTQAFLNYAFSGKAEEAAALGEPGKSYSRPKKIKEFEKLGVKNPPAIVRLLADDEYALAITDPIVSKEKKRDGRKEGGPLSIRLVKKDNRWMIRDVDGKKDQAEKNLKRFQKECPKAKDVIPQKAE